MLSKDSYPEEQAQKKHPGEHLSYLASEALIQAGARPLAKPILQLELYRRRNEPALVEQGMHANPPLPAGPFVQVDPDCCLFIYVPVNMKSRLMDELSGGYGYSHVTIDLGEADQPTGKRVMVESMMGQVVRRVFQDLHGSRPFLRVPLSHIPGINLAEFRQCVLASLGEPYDYKEVLTWRAIDDPAKQVCSDMFADCLPESVQEDIARRYKMGQLGRRMASIHYDRDGKLKMFVSPNAFARYFGAPPGRQVDEPGTFFYPRTFPNSNQLRKKPPLSRVAFPALALILLGAFAWFVLRPAIRRRSGLLSGVDIPFIH